MKISDETLQKIHDTSIVTVAVKLGMKLYGTGDENRKACCPYHEDQHPSLHFSTKRGCFKCFVCGTKGDAIKLVQDQENLTFTEACKWIIKECNIIVTDDAPVKTNTNPTNQTNKKESVQSEQSVVKKTDSSNSTNSCVPLVASEQSSSACSENKSVSSVQSVVEKKDISVISVISVCSLSPDLVSRSMSLNSEFCKSALSAGYLTESQLRHAASRYHLGASKDGGVVFWEIDDQQQVHTGKIMYYQPDCHRDKNHNPTWVHKLMKDKLPANYELLHCLFGLHLLSNTNPTNQTNKKESVKSVSSVVEKTDSSDSSNSCSENNFSVISVISVCPKNIAIVESEKSAVILSEIFKDFIWMSCGGLQMFKPELLAPLVNHKVVVFPDTDETGEAYKKWFDVLQQASKTYPFRYPLRISRLLEDHATPEQKTRKIDIVDYIFHTDLTDPTDSVR